MRTKVLKIDKKEVEAVLVCGGSGFKVYTASNVTGWIIVKGRKLTVLDSQIVSNYVNIRYMNIEKHDEIKNSFNNLVETL